MRVLAVFSLALIVVGCSGDSSGGSDLDVSVSDTGSGGTGSDTGGTGGDGTGGGTGDTGGTGGDGTGDGTGDTGGGTGEGSGDFMGDRKPLGSACTEDYECDRGLCLYMEAGLDQGFCSGYCFQDEDCDMESWECVFIRNSGGDAAFVCVSDDLCIDPDGDGYGIGPGCIAPDCDEGNPYVNFGALEICDGIDNNCNGLIDENVQGAGEPCDTGYTGLCGVGYQICEGGIMRCQAANTMSTEICDGIDNNCDGTVDLGPDGQPLTMDCFAGDPALIGMGECRAGVRVCSDGMYGDCVGQVLPEIEVCDGVDNNCDGTVDLGPDGQPLAVSCYEGSLSTLGFGNCRAGTRTCLAGEYGACEGQILPSFELCNGIDDNCDGRIDEGNPEAGYSCDTGLPGICKQGVTVCEDAEVSCIPMQESHDEICDGLDNNCNGQIDEDFKNANGIYNQVEHCGGCGVNCNAMWSGGAAALHVIPACHVESNVARCAFDCEPGWFDVDRDPSNGCEFSPDPDAVYVSSTDDGGVDFEGCGTPGDPCASISYAINNVANASTRPRVLVSDGLFNETVTMKNGVSVLGGHSSRNWVRDPAVYVSLISGTNDGLDNYGVKANGITSATTLSGFTIFAAPGRIGGGNSIGIHIQNSNQNLQVRDNRIYAGPGGVGGAGTNGSAGQNGAAGGAGLPSTLHTRNTCSGTRAGGSAGSRTCGGQNVSGGQGGTSSCPVYQQQNGSGANGQGPSRGTGGAGAFNMSGSSSGCATDGRVIDAMPGVPGNPGTDGSGGAGATGNGSLIGGLWRGANGSAGNAGTNGSGGGGGGAGAGVQAASNTYQDHRGTSGGGGGSGGCQGTAGGGGIAGGGSFAILMVWTGTAPSNASQLPVVEDNLLVRGLGGNGGSGGNGGAGGDPGTAGIRGHANKDGAHGFCMFDAGDGGIGGRGGHGGGGGGGNGGMSYDIMIWGYTGGTGTMGTTGNSFAVANGSNTGGALGAGGQSSNTDNVGGNGVAGTYGNMGKFN